ncbi:hypothetical protein DXG03_002010 [Asterophora parasitica]|uniref:Uncharacterized protein n=1 Tax=Asterophora parasitica TaxID=117018 RepID=A0A9P7G8V8_9AGAR|nr:hypothetical protein DXG03_002010 [Asterophora parasitica]
MTSTSQSSESLASPRAPISPFSITSSASDSHYTSDDFPDLGAFNTVIREWTYLQPPLRIPAYHPEEPTASGSSLILTERTYTGTEGTGRRSTVWNHQPIAEYLISESDDQGETDTEGARSVDIEIVIDDEQSTQIEGSSSSELPPNSYMLSPLRTQPSLDDSSAMDSSELLDELDADFQPSLGYLDEALSFIAAERARLDAQRAAAIGTASPDAWKHVIGKYRFPRELWLSAQHAGIESRRKRRRKRPGRRSSSSQPQASTVSPSPNTSDIEASNHVLSDPEEVTEEEDGEGDDEDDGTPQYKPRSTPASKSTPMTPRPPRGIISINALGLSSDSNDPSTSETTKVKTPRKRSRSKNKKPPLLAHSRSTPALRTLASLYSPVLETAADPGTHCLVTLARYLGQVCPAEKGMLTSVEKKLIVASKGQQRTPEEEELWFLGPEMALDPRGRPPRASDPPVHVFIDQLSASNILFGFLTYLKRHPQPTLHNTHQAPDLLHVRTTTTNTPIPLPSFATAGHSLRTDRHSLHADAQASPSSLAGSPQKSKAKPAHVSTAAAHAAHCPSPSAAPGQSVPIPISISTSSTSDDILLMANERGILSGGGGGSGGKGGWGRGEESDDDDDTDRGQTEDDDSGDAFKVQSAKSKRPARHLSHTALTLILERGRPVTRRVVVTSSPLYQPMDTMERLGYEVRVYIRVPDLGDGMDRQNKHGHSRTKSGDKWSPKKVQGHVRRVSGGTSTDSAGPSTSPSKYTGDGGKGSFRSSAAGAPPSSFAFSKRPSSSPASNDSVPPTPPLGSLHHQRLNQASSPPRIKYREQGVDELLQLKLHQALAATDDVPEGATIVLATGDGNIGQFNEDGFLGPVRTALKRGWRVELYAWEDGLSRAWRREFGLGSEWARTGRFHIIGMEQFAASLVKGGL